MFLLQVLVKFVGMTVRWLILSSVGSTGSVCSVMIECSVFYGK